MGSVPSTTLKLWQKITRSKNRLSANKVPLRRPGYPMCCLASLILSPGWMPPKESMVYETIYIYIVQSTWRNSKFICGRLPNDNTLRPHLDELLWILNSVLHWGQDMSGLSGSSFHGRPGPSASIRAFSTCHVALKIYGIDWTNKDAFYWCFFSSGEVPHL